MQYTIKKEIKSEGVGIHYNKFANLTLKPAEIDTGIIIKRVDVKDKNNTIIAHFSHIKDTFLSTKLINADGIFVATVEHLMATLAVYKITNLIIEINSIEVPIMDGGSEDFCFMIECAGLLKQEKKATKFALLKDVKVGNEQSYIIAKPSNEFCVNFISDFKSNIIGKQSFKYSNEVDFVKDVSSARTIANFNDVSALQSAGFGLGGNLQNTLVFNEESVLNEPCIYNKDDFVKHKVLDFIGDLYLCGGEVIADFECFKSGHKLNHSILKEIFSDTQNYKLI